MGDLPSVCATTHTAAVTIPPNGGDKSVASATKPFAICEDCITLGRCRRGIPASFELPARGVTCPYTGYSRSFLEKLIYGDNARGATPMLPVERVGKPGALRSRPTIAGDILCAFLRGKFQGIEGGAK